MCCVTSLIDMFNSNPMIPQYYWNGQLVWTPVAGNMSRRSATMTSDPSHT